ncbi:hypothetical protein CU103_30535 [Phyllobacterium sophorae]|uniref:Uncharacterized protein n=1 Tax=Phyllobacterium sophorae TaxID=1520277 RepID=A0A2P7AN21_9HYPH|nr:hypothetical protein CU103_30535 [Phyllobacterium sophorae]
MHLFDSSVNPITRTKSADEPGMTVLFCEIRSISSQRHRTTRIELSLLFTIELHMAVAAVATAAVRKDACPEMLAVEHLAVPLRRAAVAARLCDPINGKHTGIRRKTVDRDKSPAPLRWPIGAMLCSWLPLCLLLTLNRWL